MANDISSTIKWADVSLNVITGCLNHVDGYCKGGGFPCYAYKLAHGRLKERYLANKNTATDRYDEDSYPFYPRFWPERLTTKGIPKGSLIFLNDMSDWMGSWIPDEWKRAILDFIEANPDHTFLTLTKQPQELVKWNPFPENCWVGVTATNSKAGFVSAYFLRDIQARVKFCSVEPMLGDFLDLSRKMPWFLMKYINWLIIGSCTGTRSEMLGFQQKYPDLTVMPFGRKWTCQPKVEWVQEIVEAADKAGVKVFLKDNLNPLFANDDCKLFTEHKNTLFTFKDYEGESIARWHLRQEFPC